MTVDDPYRRCGLLGNPFAHPERPADADADWVDVGVPDAPAPGGRRLVQVLGVKGAGKSTTLRRWRRRAPGPARYVPPDPRRFRPLPVAPLVYWDEADRAPEVLLRRALRSAGRRGATVVAGTHRDLTEPARAAGLDVRTVAFTEVTPEWIGLWARRRFAAVAAPAPPLSGRERTALTDPRTEWELPEDVAARVARECAASWRAAGDLLHVWVARQVAERCGDA